ncbi:MAG TPA: extracellular solute-binding protein [Pseudonocardiaceae bacterium]|jgi:iron(III) transport system substrate-binding protein
MPSRRTLSAVAIATTLVIALAACSRTSAAPSAAAGSASGAAAASNVLAITPQLVAAANKEGSVDLLYAAPLASEQALIKAFNAQYPNIKVTLTRNAGAPGGAKLLQDFQAGVKDTDLFEGSDITTTDALSQAGAFVNIKPTDAALYPKGYVIAPGVYAPQPETIVVAFNTKLVTASEAAALRDWNGVLDPKWKGKLAVVTPTTSAGGIPALYGDNTVSPDFLTKLHAQAPKMYDGTAGGRDAIVSGQQAIAFGEFDDAMITLVKSGAPVGFVYPNPAPQFPDAFYGVLTNAPHPNAARLLWAFMTSKSTCELRQSAEINSKCELTGVSDSRAQPTGEPWFQPLGPTWIPTTTDWSTNLPALQKKFASVMGTP